MTHFPEIDLPLAAISGRSRLNPRPISAPPERIEELAATIADVGMIEPLLLIEEDGAYAALNGGNRIDALRLLQARAPDNPIVVRGRLFAGTEIEAREVAAAVSLTQTPMHVVDKIEAFQALVQSGATIDKIARAFNATAVEVRRCLKLADLSPIVRGLWRDGKITREVAIAFTHGSREAQEALIETRAVPLTDAHLIARRLRADSLEPTSAEARFLAGDPARVSRYIDSGGRIEEDLFADAPVFLNAAIAVQYVKKGDQLFVSGQIETREYTDKDGATRRVTEIVLRPFSGELKLLNNQRRAAPGPDDYGETRTRETGMNSHAGGGSLKDQLNDEIPF